MACLWFYLLYAFFAFPSLGRASGRQFFTREWWLAYLCMHSFFHTRKSWVFIATLFCSCCTAQGWLVVRCGVCCVHFIPEILRLSLCCHALLFLMHRERMACGAVYGMCLIHQNLVAHNTTHTSRLLYPNIMHCGAIHALCLERQNTTIRDTTYTLFVLLAPQHHGMWYDACFLSPWKYFFASYLHWKSVMLFQHTHWYTPLVEHQLALVGCRNLPVQDIKRWSLSYQVDWQEPWAIRARFAEICF